LFGAKYDEWVRSDPQDAPPAPLPTPEPPPEELFAAGLSPGSYWGRLSPEKRALVLNVLHKHPQLTLAEALSHLWFFGRFVIGPTAILDLPARALIR
jgi:hypothetical protein